MHNTESVRSASQLRRLLDGAALSEHATRCGHVIDDLPRLGKIFRFQDWSGFGTGEIGEPPGEPGAKKQTNRELSTVLCSLISSGPETDMSAQRTDWPTVSTGTGQISSTEYAKI